MDTLQSTAGRLMDGMRAGVTAGMAVEDWVVFIGPEGGYQMIAGYEGSLEALKWDRGARRAWRVVRRNGGVFVEGREGERSCEFSTAIAQPNVKHLVQQAAVYSV